MDGKPIKPPDHLNLVKVSDPNLSPDGETVAFIQTEPCGNEKSKSTIYTVSTGNSNLCQFTAKEGDDSQPRWSPTGDQLAFASDRGDSDHPQIRILPADGGESRQITNVVGGVSNLSWSPDGSKIAFTQTVSTTEREEGHDCYVDEHYERDVPDPRVIDRMIYRVSGEYLDGKRSHVYIVELETGSVVRITSGDSDFVSPVWGGSSTLYYAMRQGADDSVEFDIKSYDIHSNHSKTIKKTTGLSPFLAARTDGCLAYTITPENKISMRQSEVELYDPEADETVTLTKDMDRTLARFSPELGLEWGPDQEYIYFVVPNQGNFQLHGARTTDESRSDRSSEPAFITNSEKVSNDNPNVSRHVIIESGTISGFSVNGDGIVITRSEWDHPGDVFINTDGETKRLTAVNGEYLDTHAVMEPEEIRFESEGQEIQGWVLRPPSFNCEKENRQYPLVVEIHGGPHTMWSTSGSMWHEYQAIAAAGYVVFWCNPRGSTGYGEEFAMDIEGKWGEVTMTDVMAGLDAVTQMEEVDTDTAFVTGGSFGGYAASWIVGKTDKFDAAVTQRGIYELSSFYGSSDAFRLVEDAFGTVPWEKPEVLWEQSPVKYVEGVDTPVLVIHSEADFRTPINTAEMYYLFLQKNGVETRFVRYPREGHELSRSGEPKHVVDRLERIVRWFGGYSDHHDVPPALERPTGEGLTSEVCSSPEE